MTLAEFDVWISQNRKKLIRVAWKTVGKLDAEDAVQMALARILANRAYEKVQKNPIAYFSTIVRSAASNARRGRKRDKEFRAGLTHLLSAGVLRSGSSRKPTMDQQEGR